MIIIILFFHIWRLCLTLKTLGVEKTNTMLTLLIHIFLNIYILFYFFQIFFCFLSSSILTIIFRMKNVLILFLNKNCVIDMNINLFVYKLLCDIYFKSLFFFFFWRRIRIGRFLEIDEDIVTGITELTDGAPISNKTNIEKLPL